jgi:DNA processing protein
MQNINLGYWLALKFVPRLSIAKKRLLVQQFGIKSLFSVATAQLSQCGLTPAQIAAIRQPDWPRIEQIMQDSMQCSSEIICFDDKDYPQILKHIHDPPLLLFVRGNKALLNRSQIAMVGSRNASIYGKETTLKLAQQLAEQGLVVTSGLALGIDTFAHKGTLTLANSTIAVVATGLDQVYPTRNKTLFHDILTQGGLVISEFPPKTMAKAGNFPQRNRIISGLTLGVVVVEAAMQSGSLITARCAIEQNREVFALPGSIYQPLSKGCHWLIKQGAKLIEDCADIMEEYSEQTKLQKK